MKKLILSLAAVAALASCSQEESNNVPEVVPGNVPITVSAGIGTSVESKAVVDGSQFAVGNNVFSLVAYSSTSSSVADYTTVYSEMGPVNVNCVKAEPNDLELATPKYYPTDVNTKLFFYAYAPTTGSFVAGNTTTAPKASFTIDGTQDIMWAVANENSSGGIAKNPTNQEQPTLSFAHKLMQIDFKTKADASFAGGDDVKVTKITIKNINIAYSLDLVTGNLTATGEANQTISTNEEMAINQTESSVFGALMVLLNNQNFTIDVIANGQTYSNINVDLGENPVAGTRYTITLNFKNNQIDPDATIQPWTDGKDVTIDVQ